MITFIFIRRQVLCYQIFLCFFYKSIVLYYQTTLVSPLEHLKLGQEGKNEESEPGTL